jgi:hypothetical protein
MIFLLQYERKCRRLVSVRTFDNWEAADKARLDLELRLNRNHPANDVDEVVLLEATDEQALRHTHARYFDSISDLAEPTKAAAS